jgi:hypothetical protein
MQATIRRYEGVDPAMTDEPRAARSSHRANGFSAAEPDVG